MTYDLRPARAADGEFLFRVYASTRQEELAAVAWSSEQKEHFLRMQFSAQHAYYHEHYRGGTFDVLLVDDQPAGRLYVFRTAREIRIVDIALLPLFRRKGIGERVFRDLFAEADRGAQVVSIHVERANPARRLYERLGFSAVSEGEESPIYIRMDRLPVTGA